MPATAHELFEELYRSEFKKMLLYARTRLNDAQSAEEVVQDTFIVAHLKMDALMRSPSPKGWLYNTLKNKLMHELRARARFSAMLGRLKARHAYPDTAADMDPDRDEPWRDILCGLSDSEYELLKLIYIDGYSSREAAEICGMTYDACRKAVQRAKEKLRKNRTDGGNAQT